MIPSWFRLIRVGLVVSQVIVVECITIGAVVLHKSHCDDREESDVCKDNDVIAHLLFGLIIVALLVLGHLMALRLRWLFCKGAETIRSATQSLALELTLAAKEGLLSPAVSDHVKADVSDFATSLFRWLLAKKESESAAADCLVWRAKLQVHLNCFF